MSYFYKVQHIPVSRSKRPGTKIKVEYITIHSTGNTNSTAQNERDWLTNPNNSREASWHICLDDKEAIEAIPLNEIAYHAGNREGNNKSIGIEICESGDRQKTLQNASKLVAEMLYKRGWGIEKLKRHYDWSGKNCPRILNYNNWEGWYKFKEEVKNNLEKLKKPSEEVKDMKEQTVSNWAKEAWEWAKEKGITDGSRPQDNATREEIITMLYRFKEVIK